jgi:hypothetical protein
MVICYRYKQVTGTLQHPITPGSGKNRHENCRASSISTSHGGNGSLCCPPKVSQKWLAPKSRRLVHSHQPSMWHRQMHFISWESSLLVTLATKMLNLIPCHCSSCMLLKLIQHYLNKNLIRLPSMVCHITVTAYEKKIERLIYLFILRQALAMQPRLALNSLHSPELALNSRSTCLSLWV